MTLRVGFFGGGFIARYHASMLRGSNEEVCIGAVYDPDHTKAAEFAEHSGAVVAGSAEELLDSIDAAYVCTWTSEHLPVVRSIVEREMPVFCEKPLGVDLDTARQLESVVREAGVINQVGLVLRDSPAFRLVRSLLADPVCGALQSIVFRDDQFLPVQGTYRSSWRADPARAGRGTLLEHSIHDVDLLEWLAGPIDHLSALVGDHHGMWPIEDSANLLMRHQSGATSTLSSVWHDVLSRPSQRRVELFCERTWIALEGDVFGPVRWTRQVGPGPHDAEERVVEGTELLTELAERGEVLRNPDEAFVRAVVRDEPASPTVTEALRAHVLVDAAYRSAAEGGAPVSISSPTGAD